MALKLNIRANGQVAEIRLLGDISNWNNNSMEFTRKVDELIKAGMRDVKMYMTTFGGDVFEANEIRNQIKRFPGTKTLQLGAFCCSAGTNIMLEFDEIIVSPNTVIMIHMPAGVVFGDAKAITSYLQLLEIITAQYVKDYHKKTGIPETEILAMMVAETWMDAETARDKKFIDTIASDDSDDEIDEIYAIADKYKYNNIPQGIDAKLKFKTVTKTEEPNKIMNKIQILAFLAVAGITLPTDATDAQVEAAVGKVTADNKRLTEELETEKKKTVKARAKLIADAGLAAKKFPTAEYNQWLEDAEANPDMTERVLAKMQSPVSATGNLGKTEGTENCASDDKENWSWEDWRTKDPEGLEKLRQTNAAAFNKVYNKKFGTNL